MLLIMTSIAGVLLAYALLTLVFTYLVHQVPRRPVEDKPDWGRVLDTRIPAAEGGSLEVWRIEPEGPSRGTVVFVHGWGRNRDRMVSRARRFGRRGFTAVIHSSRDHGASSRRRFMNAPRFAEDIETVLGWVGEPVILYGHSIGAAAAVIAAARNPERIGLLVLEACYADTREALLSLYRWFNRPFGVLFGPGILFCMNLFYRNRLDSVSPARLARALTMPVLIIHGEKDRRFPLKFARKLKNSLPPGQSELYVAEGAGHSDSGDTPGYEAALRRFVDRHWR